MSDFIDTVLHARESGITLDSCGSEERHYSWGLYSDFCGMTVEDARKAASACCGGGDDPTPTGKTDNNVVFALAPYETGYTLTLTFSALLEAPLLVSYSFNGVSKSITVPAGVISYDTGDFSESKFGSLTNITFVSSDEKHNFVAVNTIKSGMFTLLFNVDGKEYSKTSVRCGTIINIPETPTEYAEGYDFSWVDSSTGEAVEEGYIMPEKDVTIDAVHVVHSWTIYYSYDGIELPSGSVKVNYGTKLNTIPVIKETGITGYNFSRWDVIDESNSRLPETMPDNNLTIIGLYMIKTLNLIFKIDGVAVDSIQYTYGAEIHPGEDTGWPKDPVKTGYTFNGWGDIPPTMPDNHVILNANFTVNVYKISYNLTKEGTPIILSDSEFNFGETIRLVDYKEEGFTRSEWEYDDGEIYTTMPAKDLSVSAELERNSYMLTFEGYDGRILFNEKVPYETELESITPVITGITGYTFKAWEPEVPETMPAEEKYFKAQFEANKHTITYKVDDVDKYSEQHTYGDTITLREPEVTEGYTFSGWTSDIIPFPDTMPDEDFEVNGWNNINYHDITFYIYDKHSGTSDEYQKLEDVEYGSTIAYPILSGETGYTFSAWAEESGEVPETMPDRNVDLYSIKEREKYLLSYYTRLNGVDTLVYSAQTEYNEDVPDRTVEPKEGYNVGEWVVKEDGSEKPDTMPAHNLTLLSEYEIIEYTITYKVNGDVEHVAEGLHFGNSIPAYSATTIPEGYTFGGWNPAIPSTMPAQDLVENAILIANEWVLRFTVTKIDDGGSTVILDTSAITKYGATINYPTITPEEGYKFNGWSYTGTTMPNNDLTITGEVKMIGDSSIVYYGVDYQIAASALTPEIITAFDNFDASEKSTTGDINIPIAADAQMIAFKEEEDEIEARWEAGDIEDDEYEALLEELDERRDTYRHSYKYGTFIAAPEGYTIAYKDNGSPVSIDTVKNIEIEDAPYVLYMYNNKNAILPLIKDTFIVCEIIAE